jgi:hypothetical protein
MHNGESAEIAAVGNGGTGGALGYVTSGIVDFSDVVS